MIKTKIRNLFEVMVLARSDSRGNNSKELILKKAIEIILEEDLNALSARKLAKALNMTATNIYNYYDSKTEIIYAVKNYGFKMLKKDMLDRYESEEDPLTNIHNFISGYVAFAMNNRKIYNIMFDQELNDYIHYREDSPIFGYSFLMADDSAKRKIRFPQEIIDTVDKAKKNNPRISDTDTYNLVLKLFVSLHGLITVYNNDLLAAFEINDLLFIKDYVDFLSRPYNFYTK